MKNNLMASDKIFKQNLLHSQQKISSTLFLEQFFNGRVFQNKTLTTIVAANQNDLTSLLWFLTIKNVLKDPKLRIDYFTSHDSYLSMRERAIALLIKLKLGVEVPGLSMISEGYHAVQDFKKRHGKDETRKIFLNPVLNIDKKFNSLIKASRLNVYCTQNWPKIKAVVQRNRSHHKEYLAVINGLDWMHANGNKRSIPSKQHLAYLSKHLKLLTDRADCPILVSSPLNHSIDVQMRPSPKHLYHDSTLVKASDQVFSMYDMKNPPHDANIKYIECIKGHYIIYRAKLLFDSGHGSFKTFEKKDLKHINDEIYLFDRLDQ